MVEIPKCLTANRWLSPFFSPFLSDVAKATRGRAPNPEARLFRFGWGFFPNVTHAQAVLGVTSGDFARAVAPAQFSSQKFNAGPALIDSLFAGNIDVGYVGPGPVINAFAKSRGSGIRVIAGAACNGVLIVARNESGIVQLSDLKGHRLATPQRGNTQDIAARHYLLNVLGQPNIDNILPVDNADQFSMMQRGQIDAAWVPEPWGSLLIRQAGAHLVGEEKDLWPEKEFALTVIVTTPAFLAQHADLLDRLLTVNRDWTTRLNTNPADCAAKLEDGLASFTSKRLPAGVVADSLTHVKFSDQPLPQTLKTNEQWAFELGVSKQRFDLSTLTDLSVLQKLPAVGQ